MVNYILLDLFALVYGCMHSLATHIRQRVYVAIDFRLYLFGDPINHYHDFDPPRTQHKVACVILGLDLLRQKLKFLFSPRVACQQRTLKAFSGPDVPRMGNGKTGSRNMFWLIYIYIIQYTYIYLSRSFNVELPNNWAINAHIYPLI